MDALARDYVALARALDRLDPGYVDAYNGTEPAPQALTLREIEARARTLVDAIALVGTPRSRALLRETVALLARAELLSGHWSRFDDESRRVLGVVAPPFQEDGNASLLEGIDELLPGEGPLVKRYRDYRGRFVVPEGRVEAVLRRALEECRAKTQRHVDLPVSETVRLELVDGAPWAAYHTYQGGYRSLVRVNRGPPFHVERAIDEMCHEGYPGHHVQQVLAERELVEARGMVEYALLAARGPRAFASEAAATYGVELVFPPDERVVFERDVLFPLAGLPSEEAARYDAVRRAVQGLAPAVVEGARLNLDGALDRYSAALWLEEHALLPDARSTLEFAWRERTQILGYTLGASILRRRVGAAPSAWAALVAMWTEPNDFDLEAP